MSSLNAKPGYNEANSQYQALKQQVDSLLDQRDAAARQFGIDSAQAQQYQQQASALAPQVLAANNRVQEIIATPAPDLASPTVTTGQSQSTPAPNTRDDGPTQAATSAGVGAGTSNSSANSIGADNNPRPTSSTIAVNVSTAALNQLIPTQPNQLDQYASYTYTLGWYVLSPEQFNDMMRTGRPNVSSWQLLMQSGGAPIAGRSPAFPLDYYMDDLEIVTKTPLGGTRLAHSATDLRFKVVEPNGITLLQSLFDAVQSVNKSASQSQTNTTNATGTAAAKTAGTARTVNYLQAQYCLTIQFSGYDKDGNSVSPARGAVATGTQATGQTAVIIKYYPFRLVDIRFQLANRAIEYIITAKPVAHSYGYTTDRGTVPFGFAMTGQTVEQLLNGPRITAPRTGNEGRPGKPDTARPNQASNSDIDQFLLNAGTNDARAGSVSAVSAGAP